VNSILDINQISKKFSINHERLAYLSLRDQITGIFSRKTIHEDFWALRDVSFTVNEGDAVGIIGRNGAGKSTLLKILSRITPPTTGRIISRGRIASLLEVGTGFHQELTGRENVFMNGSILGMKKQEIRARFDEIIEFSGTSKFLDTPLKHYSSGMQLRLAFAVAAHLEPEILIVDEVLAVGDGEFQKKCLKKMEDVNGQGRTVLFVSHNLPTLKAICKTGVLLRSGKVDAIGNINEVVDQYLSSHQSEAETLTSVIHYYQPHLSITKVKINNVESVFITLDMSDERSVLNISMQVEFFKKTSFELDVHLKHEEQHVASYSNFVNKDTTVFERGVYQFEYAIQLPELRSGRYKLDLFFTEPFISWFAVIENAVTIDIINPKHHTFLNTSSLKWGSILLQGNASSARL
jgi:ABC-type polysaccharide/polyol phosphate transport system ATPase subunit